MLRVTVFCCLLVQFLELTYALNPETLCAEYPDGKYTHPHQCQLYYDCSKKQHPNRPWLEPYLMECDYPNLFHSQSKTCEHYSKANQTCGGKTIPIDKCDYWTYKKKCYGINCQIPCYHEVENASCKNMPDGKNPLEPYIHTPKYLECENERNMGVHECPYRNGEIQIFDHSEGIRECVPYEMKYPQ